VPASEKKRKRITDAWLKSYSPTNEREDWWDTLVDGFGVRISKTGRKTFHVRYRTDAGPRRRQSIGRYPALSLADAREEAQRIAREVEKGSDPAAEQREQQDATFGAMAESAMDYLAERTRPKTQEDRRVIVNSELLPARHRGRKRAGWKDRPAGSVTRAEVIELHKSIHGRGNTRWANETLKTIHRLYNVALRLQFPGVEYNPAAMVEHFPEKPVRAPDRYLTREEISKLWHALEDENILSAGILRLALLTAQRWGAVAKMRWSDVDVDRWTIPGEPGDKIKIRWTVPLSDPACEVLEEVRMVSGRHKHIFPSRAGARKPYIASIKELMSRIRPKVGGEHWVAHDLRTTFRTHATRSKTPQHRRGCPCRDEPDETCTCGATKRAGLGIDGVLADLVGSRVEQSVGFRSYQGNKAEYRIDDRADALDAWAAFVMECARGRGA
jgi:integrase